MNDSMFWYDLETFGLSPFTDRIAQFAGVRTDMDLNIIDDPVILYCRPTPDYLPTPQSCLVTGITPQIALKNGIVEDKFIEKILKQIARPKTVTVGFNNIGFDDEFIRNCLYRNFYDPYEREWKNGCSRWDVLDLVRACHDLRPDGINFFHKSEDGKPQFKLVYLTEDNRIEQVGAHDALVDVIATINVVKLIRQKQPKLYDFYFSHRSKDKVFSLVDTVRHTPVLYTCAQFTAVNGCTRPVAPLTVHPEMANTVYAFDLTCDANELVNASEDNILTVPGLVKIQANKCPYIAPIEMLTRVPEVQNRLGTDRDLMERNLSIIKSNPEIMAKLRRTKKDEYPSEEKDPDARIYSDGFTTRHDKELFEKIRSLKPADKLRTRFHFDSEKASKMLFRHVARNYPEVLTEKEREMWKNFCAARLLQPIGKNPSLDTFQRTVSELLESVDTTGKEKLVLIALREYAANLSDRIVH
ncbi:MAG: exodeoxyribonuclease I [Sphaerochaetaceae bacterium]|nr:exodeoxyribonuclease I [Sphaerochaetaceae bacterium]